MSEHDNTPTRFKYSFFDKGEEVLQFRIPGKTKGCALFFLSIWIIFWGGTALIFLSGFIKNGNLTGLIISLPFLLIVYFSGRLLIKIYMIVEFRFTNSKLIIINKLFIVLRKRFLIRERLKKVYISKRKGIISLHAVDDRDLKLFSVYVKEDCVWLGEKIAEWAGIELEATSDP